MGVRVVRIMGLRSYDVDCLECDVANVARSNVSLAVILEVHAFKHLVSLLELRMWVIPSLPGRMGR